MSEAQAANYRKLARELRGKAAEALSIEFRRQWLEIAKHYDALAELEQTKIKPRA